MIMELVIYTIIKKLFFLFHYTPQFVLKSKISLKTHII